MNKKNEKNIRDRAYRIWQDEGRPARKDKEHWERACKKIEEEAEMTEGHHNLNCE